MRNEFMLADELQKLQEDAPENYYIPNEIIISEKSDSVLARYLTEITDSIQISSENISDPEVYDKIRSFLKYFPNVRPNISSRLFDIILSAFRVEIKSTVDALNSNEKETFKNHGFHLELYGFLLYWFLLLIEKNDSTTTATSTGMAARKSKSSHSTDSSAKNFDWNQQKLKAFDLANWLLGLRLSKIWTLKPNMSAFVTLFTKPAYRLLENPVYAKATAMKERVFRILSTCIKHYDQSLVAQSTIMQNLQYWEHCAEPMAELLVYMVRECNYTQLADEILQDISNREFKDATSKEVKDSPNGRTFANFLLKLTELSPKTILKNLAMVINQLDGDSYLMRVTIIDILGSMIAELAKSQDDNPNHMRQINGFFDILEERMLDSSAYVRQKVLQVYLRLFKLKIKFPKRRHTATVLTIRHLQEKSSIVRKFAIRALTTLITTHPYSIYGGELNYKDWKNRLDTLNHELENATTEDESIAFAAVSIATSASAVPVPSDQSTEMVTTESSEAPQQEIGNDDEMTVTEEDVEMTEVVDSAIEKDESGEVEAEKNTTEETIVAPQNDKVETSSSHNPKTVLSAEKLQQLALMRTFHKDAITFMEQIHSAVPVINQLLSSKSKAEVLESMDFLMVCYNYKIELATEGIKKMLHLIWTKDTSDEGKGIKMKLISCFENLYLDFDANLSEPANVSRVAGNLIGLTYNTNLAELTSLEQLLVIIMTEESHKISDRVIQKLWSVYGSTNSNTKKAERRGAIIILGMLAKAKTSIVLDKINLMLKIGLGSLGKNDLGLAKYTCIALQRLEGIKSKQNSRGVQEGVRYPLQHPMFPRLKNVLEQPTESTEWFSLAERVINTIYLLCEQPEKLCEDIICNKTVKVFFGPDYAASPRSSRGSPDPFTENTQTATDSTLPDYDLSTAQQALSPPNHSAIYQNSIEIAQLFFIVGHVALKQIVHLEVIESVWKRKKAKKEQQEKAQQGTSDKEKPGASNAAVEDELDQVGGTTEDDIGDVVAKIRERELLFGSKTLLSMFSPLLREVCSRNKVYTDRVLQVNATLALTKFMCVSSEFCEKHLQLLFTILEKSKDATIRSNIVIALGDMAVCFNTLIDDNITFLYNRLSDPDALVKKNAVMVLTHLILNGMIKVKGQISEMAKCLEDPDQRIADLAKLFFTELASKDNAIYNNLPDIISNLTSNSSTAGERLEEEPFRKIMKFVFSFDFTEKEKQAENIVDKLCQRLLQAEDERSWRDITYCLSLLPFKSEKTFKKLIEGWPAYQDKIHEDTVYKSFQEIIQKGRLQKTPKPELKTLVSELEQKIEKQRAPLSDKPVEKKAGKTSNKANASAAKKAKSNGGSKAGSSSDNKNTKEKKPVRNTRSTRRRMIIDDEDESDDYEGEKDESEENNESEDESEEEDEPEGEDESEEKANQDKQVEGMEED